MEKKDNVNEVSGISTFTEIFKSVFIGIVVAFIVLCMVRLTVVNGQSMENTLSDKDKMLLSRVSYFVDDPERGDIVVAKPSAINVDYIIKRVIAIPGDTVEIKNNVIFVNGEEIDEPYVKETMRTADIPAFTLSNDEYFLCGDNRNNSLDSRSEILGPISRDEIFGKVVFSFTEFKFY